MNKLTKSIAQITTGASAAIVLAAGKAMALTSVEEGAAAARTTEMPTELPNVLNNLTNIALAAIGAISVIMLIFGGFRYVTSGGDAKKVTDAKNTVLYAIIGLIICLLSYAIVQFVISTIGTPSS